MDKNDETVRRMMRAMNEIDGIYYYFARRLGVNENTLAFLYALSDGKMHSQKKMSDEWLIPRTTINTIVKNMVANGIIVLDSKQCAKEKSISLTKKGRQYVDTLLDGVFAAEQKAIKDTLQRYSAEFVDALEYFESRLWEEFNGNICSDGGGKNPR
uniref:HTH marR-type domain-containing protein n=1 Tax=uncultured Spirochaetaceae bacterium TaxID=201186 RepID=A0A650EPD4_9SPIO|nr:hypothetical protein Unknown280_1280 [uncultured Spirochaetaceae bacterium]